MQQPAPALARVLVVAGSDPSGGAGIQADIKTITMLGGYAMAAITALTAQNTLGVSGIQPVCADFVRQQIQACLSDIGADIIKTGMLYDADIIIALAGLIGSHKLVLDPVMIAKGGASLLQDNAMQALKTHLIPKAFLLTPNIPEAQALTGIAITNQAQLAQAGEALRQMGAQNIVIKGGHALDKNADTENSENDEVTDYLFTEKGMTSFYVPRQHTRHTHGTGCTLASAIACKLAQGMALEKAACEAQAYVLAAIKAAPGFGAGHGPLNHIV
jgi:hydroxymethylpyrimidine/phosphomethylpyrimidine kinase